MGLPIISPLCPYIRSGPETLLKTASTFTCSTVITWKPLVRRRWIASAPVCTTPISLAAAFTRRTRRFGYSDPCCAPRGPSPSCEGRRRRAQSSVREGSPYRSIRLRQARGRRRRRRGLGSVARTTPSLRPCSTGVSVRTSSVQPHRSPLVRFQPRAPPVHRGEARNAHRCEVAQR